MVERRPCFHPKGQAQRRDTADTSVGARGSEEGFAGLWLAREFGPAIDLVTRLLLPSPWNFVSIHSKEG
jgi:hypothetical protein